jgi:hypothetical protein
VHRLDAVRREPLAHRAQDGDPAAHARLEGHVDAARRRRLEDLLAVDREQCLVGRHDVLVPLDRSQDQAPRDVVAPDQLDHDRDRGVVDQAGGVGVEVHAGEVDVPCARGVELRDPHQTQREAQARRDHGGVLAQHARHARADRAEADQPDSDALRRGHLPPTSRAL